jgi:S-adenosylmethionine-diacylgycerolhomoserine-N-methlytransferase
MIPDLPPQPRILEIGCGTGKNIEQLEYHFPDAFIVGLDMSTEMLDKARSRLQLSDNIRLENKRYGSSSLNLEPFDLILLSYSLTMFQSPVDDIFYHLHQDLKPDGYLAVVDFHTSRFGWFKQWMELNHVNFSGHFLPLLRKYFIPSEVKKHTAYMGLWTYFQFVGRQN